MGLVEIITDVLIIGEGAAGLRAAIEARRAGVDVIVISKMPKKSPSCTSLAKGWITYLDDKTANDVFKSIIEEGCYLNNQKLVEIFTAEGQIEVSKLTALGVRLEVQNNPWMRSYINFNRSAKLFLCVPASRVYSFVAGKSRGEALIKPLRALAIALGIKVLNDFLAIRLMTSNGSVSGIIAVNLLDGNLVILKARAVILATGGGAQIYGRTDSPSGTTGDGYALAYKAGAQLVDMEFMEFMIPHSCLNEVFQSNLSKETEKIIMSKSICHYFLGGIKIDDNMRSSVRGLYAAGEVTGGLFGASRLEGSALADALVFGTRSGLEAARWAREVQTEIFEPDPDQIEETNGFLKELLDRRNTIATTVRQKLGLIMWSLCGAFKNSESLSRASEELMTMEYEVAKIRSNRVSLREAFETMWMFEIAKIIVKAASIRKESRGAYWRTDYKEPCNDKWLANLTVTSNNGKPRIEKTPVTITKMAIPLAYIPRIGNHCSGYFSKNIGN
ncbi:MAG: FAD-dependent oxidoreductase [Candidatus Hodarchaeota archaeon]